MPKRKTSPRERWREDQSWLERQSEMQPWETGREKLETLVDGFLSRNQEKLLKDRITREHEHRPVYFQRLAHCLRHHWEKARKEKEKSEYDEKAVVEEIDRHFKTRNVFDDVVLTVAAVFREEKAWLLFQGIYDDTFRKFAAYKTIKDVNEDLKGFTLDKLLGLDSDVKHAKLDDFGGHGNFIRWLWKVLDRCMASYNRNQIKPFDFQQQEPAAKGESPVEKCDREEMHRKYLRILQTFDKTDQLIMQLRLEEGMTLDEIIGVIGSRGHDISKDRGNLSRKIEALREKIKKHLSTIY